MTSAPPAGPYTYTTRCRVCAHSALELVKAFGPMPLVNALRESVWVPLTLMRCFQCGHYQLRENVDDAALFPADYVYKSTSGGGNAHVFQALAEDVAQRLCLGAAHTVLDIGCNDGALLDAFRPYTAHRYGVDPAAPSGTSHVLHALPWSARAVEALGRPLFTVITATNVWAHLDDLHDATALVKESLAPGGLFVVHAPWVRDLLQQGYYDTIYHEHRNYLGVGVMQRLAGAHDLVVTDTQYLPDVHGGTLRYYLQHAPAPVSPNVALAQALEAAAPSPAYFAATCEAHRAALRALWPYSGHVPRLWAYGATAKGAILNSFTGLGHNLTAVCDSTPAKQGQLYPGTTLRIQAEPEKGGPWPDAFLLTAWNHAGVVLDKLRTRGFRGQVIIPFPIPKVVRL